MNGWWVDRGAAFIEAAEAALAITGQAQETIKRAFANKEAQLQEAPGRLSVVRTSSILHVLTS